jgi:hypothetical protein
MKDDKIKRTVLALHTFLGSIFQGILIFSEIGKTNQGVIYGIKKI